VGQGDRKKEGGAGGMEEGGQGRGIGRRRAEQGARNKEDRAGGKEEGGRGRWMGRRMAG